MKIQAIDNQYFSLSAGSGLIRSAVWRLTADSPDAAPDDFAADVTAWSGIPGDPLRVPATDGTVSELPDCPVEKIAVKTLSSLCAEVTLTARRLDTEPLFSESRSADGECRRTATYRVAAASLEAALPSPGSILAWEGVEHCCESAAAEPAGKGFWEIRATGIPTVRRIVSPPAWSVDTDGVRSVVCSWFVAASGYDALLSELEVDAAAPWAGADFVVREVNSKPEGLTGFLVTAVAREVVTRMTECVRSERFAGFDDFNRAQREVVWNSRWRVHASEMEDFSGITGSPALWAGNHTVVTAVSPKRLSELEYELQIQAESLNNPDLFEQYYRDDRSNLKNRVDVSARMVEFLITPEMAGWRRGADGAWEALEEWLPEAHCPLIVTQALDLSLINRALKCVLLEETTHRSGGMSRNIDYLLEWGTAERVFDGKIGGCNGSYLRVDMEAEEIADNCGKRWTRFVGNWQLAPAGYTWNTAYWGNN